MAKTTVFLKKLNVLHIAKWYPNATDVQNGVFIKKHVLATADATNATVLFFCESNFYKDDVVYKHKAGAIDENLVYYHGQSTFKTIQLKNYYFNKIIKRMGVPDVIHLHILTPDQMIFARWARRNNVRYFVSEHWSGFVTQKFKLKSWMVRTVIKNISRKAEAVFPVSKFLKNGMLASGLTGNFKVIPNVVEVATKAYKKNNLYTFIVVSDLVDEIKNISGIIEAYQKVRNTIGPSQLIIIGDGPDAEIIQQKVATSPTGIKLLGRLENTKVLEQMAKAHCLIVNSNIETFSVVCLEARGSGLQVIATKCGGPEEFADENTLLIPIKSTSALIKGMVKTFNTQGVSSSNLDLFHSKIIGKSLLQHYNT